MDSRRYFRDSLRPAESMSKKPVFDANLARVGDAAELSAFDWTAARFHYPDAADWRRLNPPRTIETRNVVSVPADPVPLVIPERWQRYYHPGRKHPFSRLLNKDRLPRETKAGARKRVAAVRSLNATKASNTRTVNLRERQRAKAEGRSGGGVQWRIAVTGVAVAIVKQRRTVVGHGTQYSPWQALPPGAIVSDDELHAVYYQTCRDAVQLSTSSVYTARDSDSAVFIPDDDGGIMLETRAA